MAAISIDCTKNWELFRNTLNSLFDRVGFKDTANTWTQPQTIKGTATNDNAPAGYVGEYVHTAVPIGSAVSLTTGVTANVASLALSAGDWEVWASIYTDVGGATVTSYVAAFITLATLAADQHSRDGAFVNTFVVALAGSTFYGPVGRTRVSLAAPATAYLCINTAFSGGTSKAYGFLGARRIR